MKLINKLGLVMFLAAFSFMLNSCDKTKLYDTTIPASEVHFVGAASRTIQVVDTINPVPVFNLQVGTTDVSSVDRVVTYNVTSPSGAVVGTSYTIATGAPSGTVTIPAGQAIATIPIQAIHDAYPIDKIDTLVVYLSEPSIKPSTFQDTVKIYIKGPSSSSCQEENPVIANLMGDYATSEVFSGNPAYNYTTTVSSTEILSPTTAKIGVDNIWDNGWETLYFILDWSTLPGKVTPVPNGAIAGSDAADFGYSGTIQMRAHSDGNLGTFSTCPEGDEAITLYMQLGVTGLGWFSNTYIVTMTR